MAVDEVDLRIEDHLIAVFHAGAHLDLSTSGSQAGLCDRAYVAESDADPHGPAGEVHAIERRILAKNDALASRIRAWLAGREILAVNLVSSPGPGKTALLERTTPSLIGSQLSAGSGLRRCGG